MVGKIKISAADNISQSDEKKNELGGGKKEEIWHNAKLDADGSDCVK